MYCFEFYYRYVYYVPYKPTYALASQNAKKIY